jgi:hypothetical protein
MKIAELLKFLEGKKTGSGLSIAVFVPLATSALVNAGFASDDAATLANIVSYVVGGIVTFWGIVDRHIRTRKEKNVPQ